MTLCSGLAEPVFLWAGPMCGLSSVGQAQLSCHGGLSCGSVLVVSRITEQPALKTVTGAPLVFGQVLFLVNLLGLGSLSGILNR